MSGRIDDLIPFTPDDRARLNRVADLLGLVGDRREPFIDAVAAHVFTTNLKSRMSSEIWNVDDHLVAAAKAVRAVCAAVAKLTPIQRAHLGVILTRPYGVPRTRAEIAQKRKGGPFVLEPYHVIRQECDVLVRAYGDEVTSNIARWLDPTIDLDTEDNLVALLIEALDAAFGEMIDRSPHIVSGKKGKPSGAKTQWAMHRFVLRLWDFSRLYGDVTLSNRGREAHGTIVEILNVLKPMLPKRFFPGILNYSFLRKVQQSLPPDPLEDLRKVPKSLLQTP